jgi:hypothetical protein
VEIFGTVPADAGFMAYELRDRSNTDDYLVHMRRDPLIIYNSDAHVAESIGTAGGAATVDDAVIKEIGPASALLKYISNGIKN